MNELNNIIPPEYAGYAALAWVVIQALGRAYRSLADGKGLIGVWNGLIYGTNVPKAKDEPKPPMKIAGPPVALLLVLVILMTAGCSTPPERAAYHTIASIEATASAALDGYYLAVIRHQCRTNEVPEVSRRFNQLQAALRFAETAAKAGTNAIAPAALVVEAAQFTELISTLKGK
jgi:hypothetical protein